MINVWNDFQMLQQLTIKIFCISQPNFGTLFHEHHCTGLLVQFGKAGMGSLDSFFNFNSEMLMRRSTNIEFKTCCGIKTCNSMEKLHLGLQNVVRDVPREKKRENVGIFPKSGTPPSPLFVNVMFLREIRL